MIELQNISYSYSKDSSGIMNIDFSVDRGLVVAVAGANGSGKSTLLSVMAGLYKPDHGRVLVDGCQKQQELRNKCRLVLQDADMQIVGATVGEDLMLGREKLAEGEQEAKSVAARFQLDQEWDTPVHNLSWGMKKKLCLATALLDRPEVLLLDEPFSGLDYPAILEMRAAIAENRAAGLTQLISAHDLDSFIDLADMLAVLQGGRLVRAGSPHETDDLAAYGVRPPGRPFPARAE